MYPGFISTLHNSKVDMTHLTICAMLSNLVYIALCFSLLKSVDCLYEDQKGKFDWRKQFVGVPKFVYSHPDLGNLILGTESNVIASIHSKDGSIIWRQLMPKDCNLDHMSILSSSDDPRNYLIQTSCSNESGNLTHVWDPQNGLLSNEARYMDMTENDQATSSLFDLGHRVGNAKAFTVSEGISLLASDDGKVAFKDRDSTIWSREESLASITAVEFVTLPTNMRDRFGLRKRIVLVTESGKLFGLDTFTGESVWDMFERDLSTSRHLSAAKLILTLQSDEDATRSRAIVIHPDGLIIQINPISGDLIERRQLPHKIKQILQVGNADTDEGSGVIVLDVHGNAHIYPDSIVQTVRANVHRYFMTVVERSPNTLQGYKFVVKADAVVPELVWKLPISDTETIVDLSVKRVNEEVHSPARVLGDRGILYKYINPNLLAIMTQGRVGDSCSPDYYVNVYLIDGVTGALVHNIQHPKSRGPSKMVHSENWLVYSYYNTKARRNEVSSLEMFEGTMQTNSTAFSSLTRASIKPRLIEHKSFIFPSGIDAMIDTVTLRGMTNKHIIVALPTGALLEVPKIFLDPRRPINMLAEHREEGLIPYMPELPIPSESIINYDQTLLAIRGITTSPAILESTSLVFAFGLDIFFTRVTPSKTFDILKDDFDHVLITGVLIFLVVSSYVSKLLAQKKALRAAWK